MAATNDTPSVGDVLAGLPVPVKVFAVSTGSYSDYGVDSIFGARDDALAYAAAKNGLTVDEMTWWQKRIVEGRDYSRASHTKRYTEIHAKMTWEHLYVEEFDFYPPAT